MRILPLSPTRFLFLLALSLLALLLAACAGPEEIAVPSPAAQAPDLPVTVPDQAHIAAVLNESPNALPSTTEILLSEGETRTVRILGNLYTLRLSAAAEGEVTLTVNAQDFTLKKGEAFSFGDFLLRLDALDPAYSSAPRPSSADLTLRVPGVGAVRDLLSEGELHRYRFPDGGVRSLALEEVGQNGKGDDAARVTLDGEERFLSEGEDGGFVGGWVYVHHLYRVRPGATVPLAGATVTIIQNT